MTDPTIDSLPGASARRRVSRRVRAPRVAVAAALLLGTTGAAVGCASDGDASSGAPGGSPDGGTVTSPPDASAQGGDAASPPAGPARMVAINASPDLYEFRVCFAVSGDAAAPAFLPVLPEPSDESRPMPRTNYPGVASLNGATIEGISDLKAGTRITPYVVDARALYFVNSWKTATCEALFANTQDFRENVHYIALPSFPASTLTPGRTTVLVVSGCRPTALDTGVYAPNATRCGATYDAALGNIQGTTFTVSDATPSSLRTTGMSAQFVQLATAFGSAVTLSATLGPLAAVADIDGGDTSPQPLANRQRFQEPPSVVTNIPLLAEPDASDLTPFVTHGIVVTRDDVANDATDGGAMPSRIAVDLEAIQRISSPTALPSTYFANGNYLFALIGDPTDPAKQLRSPDGGVNAAFDGTGLHVVAVAVARPDDAGASVGSGTSP